MEQFSETTAALVAFLVVAGPVSVGVTKIVDFIRNLIDSGHRLPSWLWNVVAFAVGIALALGWGINLLGAIVASIPALSDMAGTQDAWGQVLTGLILGAMAGFWHDKMAQWSAAAPHLRTTRETAHT